jgi:DNA-binding transcriptional LysR family regulator
LKLSSEDLIFLQAISGSRSLADAARFLGVSAAAVTGRLKNLQTRLGVRLLDRSGRRMLFTDEGELLRTRAKMVMAELAALAIHMASFMSVLRPGTFLMCAALASISSNGPSLRIFHTGFQ